jgi:hypothetical protein
MAFLLFPLSNDQTAWVASTPAQRLHELGVQWPPQREQRPGQQQLMSMLGGGGDEFSEQARCGAATCVRWDGGMGLREYGCACTRWQESASRARSYQCEQC